MLKQKTRLMAVWSRANSLLKSGFIIYSVQWTLAKTTWIGAKEIWCIDISQQNVRQNRANEIPESSTMMHMYRLSSVPSVPINLWRNALLGPPGQEWGAGLTSGMTCKCFIVTFKTVGNIGGLVNLNSAVHYQLIHILTLLQLQLHMHTTQ